MWPVRRYGLNWIKSSLNMGDFSTLLIQSNSVYFLILYIAPKTHFTKMNVHGYYWIYNLIRAFFFQNLNVYLRETCIIVLFKVLSIWSYDIFPSFWKFVDSIPKELRRLGGQEWMKPIFDTLLWCEPYSSEGVLHRPEQMLVRRGNVRAIRRVR